MIPQELAYLCNVDKLVTLLLKDIYLLMRRTTKRIFIEEELKDLAVLGQDQFDPISISILLIIIKVYKFQAICSRVFRVWNRHRLSFRLDFIFINKHGC